MRLILEEGTEGEATATTIARVRGNAALDTPVVPAYLLRLSADRLLHNFMLYAGLPPKNEIYGGWESDTIAGHTLGHYLSALAIIYLQTGDEACRQRADYIVAELARAQKKRGTGYVGALGRKRKDGTIVDGEEIFHEVMKGDIHSGGFDLNGSWSPLYRCHTARADGACCRSWPDREQVGQP